MGKTIDMAGRRIGRLVVTHQLPTERRKARWNCACDCGKSIAANGGDLRKGTVQSCGCLQDEARTKHSGRDSAAYGSWRNAVQRVTNPNHPYWHCYGGRGITMAPAWRDSFAQFLADMGQRPEGTSLDRIDNDGPYAPGNCRWATPAQQSSNMRHRNQHSS